MALADLQTLVDSLVRDQAAVLTPADRDRAIEWARLRYSADHGRVLAEDVTWQAAGYTNALPADWLEGSYVVDAEYPIGESPRALIEMATYLTPTTMQLVVTDSLAAGSVVRVTYAAPHLLNGGATPKDTIELVHREAVASYAAHVLCKQLASHYSAERDSSINADGSNTDSRSRNYAQRAKELRGAYYAGIGKPDPQGGGSAAPGAGSAAMGGEPAASVSSWAGRTRAPNLTNGQLSGLGMP